MTESHLARTLFSQSNNAPVRKKNLRPVEQKAEADTPEPKPQLELTEALKQWQDKCHTLEQRCQALMQQLQEKELQLKELQASLSQQITQNNQQAALITMLQEQNKKLQEQLDDLEAKLAHHLQLLLSAEISSPPKDTSRQQISELQEQILRQADQIKEYQATIQHWKDQAIKHQQHAIQLSSALERLLAEKPAIAKVDKPKTAPKPEPKLEPALPKAKIELPAFLTRAR